MKLLHQAKDQIEKEMVAARTEHVQQDNLKMRSKEKREKQQRMLALWVGSQRSLMLKTSFSAWWECVYERRKLSEVPKGVLRERESGKRGQWQQEKDGRWRRHDVLEVPGW